MIELFIVLKFSDGDERYLFFTDPSQADSWAAIYKSGVPYEMLCYDSEEEYFQEFYYE